MDLSKVKWVVIAAVVLGVGWLVTEGGVNWAYDRATAGTPGEDEMLGFLWEGATVLAAGHGRSVRFDLLEDGAVVGQLRVRGSRARRYTLQLRSAGAVRPRAHAST